MPCSEIGRGCPVTSHWQERGGLCWNHWGQVSWGQLSVPEAWVFPEPKYLPSTIKKHWPSSLTLEGALYFEGRGRQFPFCLPPGFFDGALIWAWGWRFSSPGTRAKTSWPLWGLRDGRGG